MKICNVEGCNNKHHAKGFCNKHYWRFKKFGFIKRTKFDKNEFVLYDDYAEMLLYNSFGIEINRTIVDLDKIEKIKIYKWYFNKHNGYVEGVVNDKVIGLHRFIMDANDNIEIDHKDTNKLNNRCLNLRTATRIQNMHNIAKKRDNTSGVVGVCWNKEKGKWKAQIKDNGKNKFLGYFYDIHEAEKVRIRAEKEIQKEFRCINKYENNYSK
jgi:hypothetical protein